jgi:CheY-like chemotaxis protein
MKKILIIVDEADLVTLLTEVLEYESFVARSGVEALKMLDRDVYSLVITDIMMPDMDGIALIEKVISKYQSIKIIIMSGWFDGSELKQIHEKDEKIIHAILTKPFSPTELLRLVTQELESESEGL